MRTSKRSASCACPILPQHANAILLCKATTGNSSICLILCCPILFSALLPMVCGGWHNPGKPAQSGSIANPRTLWRTCPWCIISFLSFIIYHHILSTFSASCLQIYLPWATGKAIPRSVHFGWPPLLPTVRLHTMHKPNPAHYPDRYFEPNEHVSASSRCHLLSIQ